VLLKCLRELAAEPNTLKKLDREQAIATLMPLLEQLQPGYDNAMFDEAMKCMYYLCRIDKTRQELAARLGLIQQLQRCMGEDKPHLKEWSFPIICDMAYTSSVTREELWRYGGATRERKKTTPMRAPAHSSFALAQVRWSAVLPEHHAVRTCPRHRSLLPL
jgi:hypothetical protein